MGEAERFAAAAQGADRTMFSVHGSSGSNWIVLRALALERQDAQVLVARSIHHSIINVAPRSGALSLLASADGRIAGVRERRLR